MTSKLLPEALFELGYRDLISVIPPSAQLTPSSTIQPNMVGKAPGRRLPNGLWAGYDWLRYPTTADDVLKWSIDGANIGLRSARFPAVDIDVLDENLATIIEQAALATLGPAPVRIGRAPKRLLMYRTDEPFGRLRLVFSRGGAEQYLVEILGDKQQFLVAGDHPTTRKPYTWNVDLTQVPPSQLTAITRAQALAFLDQLAGDLEMLGLFVQARAADGRTSGGGNRDVAQTGLTAPSIDALREAVRAIPNTNDLFPDRDAYIRMGMAIHAACGDNEDEGEAIFMEWAAKHEADGRVSGNPETARSDWRRFYPPHAVGWNWIAEQARGFGYNAAGDEFDVLLEERPTDKPGEIPAYSDLWLAERVVARHRGILRYVPQEGKFMVWSEGRFKRDAELLAEDIVKRELRQVAVEVYRQGANAKELKESEMKATQIVSAYRSSAVLQHVRSDRAIAVSVDALDRDPWILNTPAGMIDLRTGVLLPPDADALCTKSTAVPADFSRTPERWLKFLGEVTGGDKELEGYLQRLAGYACTGSTREQHLSFLYGAGGNGKGTFVNTIAEILGDYAVTAAMDTFTASTHDKHSTDLASLQGARLVTASETQAGRSWDEALVKRLTGGDPVKARFMRQDNFTYLPQFKLVFLGNHRPRIRDLDDAMKRRLQIVPFNVKPKVVDKDLKDKLREEWPAILAWMVQGCVAWQTLELSPPASVKVSTEEYFKDEDGFGRWLEETCEIDEEAFTGTQDLWGSWREWAGRNTEYVGNQKRLVSALQQRGFERGRETTTRRMGFKGIRVNRQELGIVQ